MPDDLLNSLAGLLGDADRVGDGSSRLDHYSADLSLHEPHRPDAVVFARSESDVVDVVRYANARAIPVVPYGAGTSTDGHTIPSRGGIVIDLSAMDSVVALQPHDQTITVQPGVRRSAINRAAGEHGLMFPVDPGADATIGGMTSTNASGTTAVRYGNMRRQVLGLKVVLADGSVIRTGSRTVKSSAGYDIGQIFIGAEGTLGVIVEITLRLYPIPEQTVAVRASFADIESACAAARAIAAVSISTTRAEMLDALSVRAFNAFSGESLPETPFLFLEFAAAPTTVADDVAFAADAIRDHGGRSFQTEADPTARAKLWRARHELATAVGHLFPGRGTMMSTDVCVPVSELPAAAAMAREAAAEIGIDAALFGHVGDGHFHAVCMIDRTVAREVEKFVAFEDELVRYALDHDGTCSGEHGIGLGKIDYLLSEHGDIVPLMQAMKRMLDPVGIFNPDKLLPG
jgi:D-lactate dehydrogenase (cytochrome)